jgi:hypothetical protein
MSAKILSQDTAGILYKERRDFYLNPGETKELWSNITPFTSMLLNRSVTPLSDPDYKMFEHRSGWIKQQFSATEAGNWGGGTPGAPGDTIAAIEIGSIVGLSDTPTAGFIGFQCEIYNADYTTYKGMVLVTGVTGNDIALTSMGNPRSATNQAANIVSTDVFYVIGTAFGEGTEAPESYDDDLEIVWNSSQIFKTAVEVTGTLYETALRGYSNELARLRNEKGKEHKMRKERTMLFGQRPHGTGMNTGTDDFATHLSIGGKTVRQTMGIISALHRYGNITGDYQNIFNITGASYGYNQFTQDTEKVFVNIPTSGRKTAFVGAGALTYWSQVSASGFVGNSGWKVQLDTAQKHELGFDIRTLMTPHGVIDLVHAPVLRGPYNNYMVVVDNDNIGMTQFRPDNYATNIKTENAYDGIKDMWFSDCGLWINLMETHSLWIIN